ncbi:glycosyl transferase family protein [Aurantiacibacter suaedae]|uniref:glycosyl transferase family protein n=1 Tax=Aurantiacibacter suaedae TaxID=2545755 RepID=UPI001F5033B5|nr:glycosyl transferase family protein [Aurantiacibacter suaedae]
MGAADELAIDLIYFFKRLRGQLRTIPMSTTHLPHRQLSGLAVVMIPAWHEDKVIGHTVAHALSAWPHPDLRIYVGCYENDPATMEAAMRGAAGDPRLRIVINSKAGPTSKADCLNRIYEAMAHDEMRTGHPARMVMLHDAEDMVDPAALPLLDRAIERAEFVQLPVLPLPQPDSRWIGSHYCEEFAESHGKSMVVRAALATGLPAAGVGCAFERKMLAEMARQRGTVGPFAERSLTEDYELGLRVALAGGRSRFLRVRDDAGRLVATRAYFPSDIASAVQQKSRWIHGIALQGWDRLGWSRGFGEWWMRLRDRRGPFAALVLFCGYLLLVLGALSSLFRNHGYVPAWKPDALLLWLLWLNLASFLWRAAMRFAFTSREYGWGEGLRAVLRIPVTNVIAIMAGRRAFFAYLSTLRGAAPKWDKTEHDTHPAQAFDESELRSQRSLGEVAR